MRDPNGHDLGTLSLTWDRDRYVIRGDGQAVRHAVHRAQLQSSAAWVTSEARRIMHEAREEFEIGAFAVHDALQHELKGVLHLFRDDDGVPVQYLLVDVVDDATLEVIFEYVAIVLTTATDPAVIAEHYARTGDLVAVMIPVFTTATDLSRLAARHAALPHGECLLERIAEHPAADAAVLEAVFALAPEDHGVRHRLATHPRTPLALLQRIATFQDATGDVARTRLAAR